MAYFVQYTCKFLNADDAMIEIIIGDALSATDTNTTDFWYDLQPAGTPLVISTVNNTNSKRGGVRALQATIQFLSTNRFNLNTFTGASDGRWAVDITSTKGGITKTIFKGYLVLDDIGEDFLHPENSNVVTLVATDNLGLIKDGSLTKTDGKNPKGKFRLMDFIVWSLQKTGLSLKINVVNNLRLDSKRNGSLYDDVYLDAKTFEKEIGASENGYAVLEKIFGTDVFLTQAGGEWWIIRIDEMERDLYEVHRYDEAGVLLTKLTNQNLNQYFEQDTALELLRGTYVTGQRAKKSVQLQYNYDYPKEIIDNIDFERGTIITDTPTQKTYSLTDWVMKAGVFPNVISTPATATSVATIVKKYEDGYEKEHYVELSEPADSYANWIQSNPVDIHADDKATLSVDFSYSADISTGGVMMFVYLDGEDGNRYQFGKNTDQPAKWHQLPYNFEYETGIKGTTQAMEAGDWQTVSGEILPAPVSGKLYVGLTSMSRDPFWDTLVRYQNLRFDYKPFINGSYQKYKGQYHKTTQIFADEYRSELEEDVQLSDSPRKLFKGALFQNYAWNKVYTGLINTDAPNVVRVVGDATYLAVGDMFKISDHSDDNGIYTVQSIAANYIYVNEVIKGSLPTATGIIYKKIPGQFSLADEFINGAVNTTDQVPHPYAHIEDLDWWNQNNRYFRILQFQAKGLSSLPGMHNQYHVKQVTPHTTAKRYMMLSFEQNWYTGMWTGTMIEVHDDTIAKNYNSPKEFKYVTER